MDAFEIQRRRTGEKEVGGTKKIEMRKSKKFREDKQEAQIGQSTIHHLNLTGMKGCNVMIVTDL